MKGEMMEGSVNLLKQILSEVIGHEGLVGVCQMKMWEDSNPSRRSSAWWENPGHM